MTARPEPADDQRAPLTCSSDACDAPATEALYIAGMPGHVHDCATHGATVREFCAVVASAPLAQGRCPWPCTTVPIYHAVPRELS